MNVHEGARRMRRAGVALALIPICWCALIMCLQLIAMRHNGLGAVAGGLGLAEIFVLAMPGILLWIAGWIVEGFVKDPA